jgi:hypothetical protein
MGISQRIESLLARMTLLGIELFQELKTSEQRFKYRFIHNFSHLRRVADPSLQTVSPAIPKLTSAINWRHIASISFIYLMIIPFVFIEITFTLYQEICFRMYQIALVIRTQYSTIDRHVLKT